MKLTFLGTGTSYGVPKVGCSCAVCKSTDPRDKRTRVGAVVETGGGTRILIDTPPELRLQLIGAGIDRLDAVLFTHDHADHTHGIDDLRPLTTTAALPFYGSRETIASLKSTFGYVVDNPEPAPPGLAKPEATSRVVEAGVPFRIGDTEVTAVQVPHGPGVFVFGYRFGNLAYVTDAKSLPDDVISALRGVKVLVLNALFRTPHPTHLSFPEAVDVARKVGASRTYLTHLTHDNFHADLEAELPSGITPAFDGLTVRIE